MSTVPTCLRTALAVCVLIAAAAILPSVASGAGDTTWICKPGQADDLCAGTIDGKTNPAPGEASEPLGYRRPKHAPIDCFYLYPTQSEQPGPNSNLDKDPPIRRVVVQQARMFSTVCDVYAPMYRQVTSNGDQSSYNDSVESAYRSARSGFKAYLRNHNDGRGFILLGHSQGAAHTARLIDEMVDGDAKLRKRFIGAIAPGANIPVPIGKAVGGMYENVPACTSAGEFGCVIAFSTYSAYPGINAAFSRLDTGYWIYPEARFDAGAYEAMCTDPGRLDGGDGTLLPLVNFDYLTGVPTDGETAAPWSAQPDFYEAGCKRRDGAHWLNISKVGLPGDDRPDLGAIVASGTNYHVPEVNLAEGNLLTIAQMQIDSYESAQARIAKLERKLAKQKQRRAALLEKAEKLEQRGDATGAKRALRRAQAAKRKIRSLKRKLAALEG